MVVREDGLGVTQTAHSVLTGRLADAWRLDPDLPAADLRTAAAIHDIGWTEWEQYPSVDAATGLPCPFHALPAAEHVAIWTRGTDEAATFGRWVGLLVSLHCTRLMGWRIERGDSGPEVEALVAREHERQRSLATGLDDGVVDRARALVGRWDGLSLQLCAGETPRLDPWPFVADHVTLHVDARDLHGGGWRTLDVSLTR